MICLDALLGLIHFHLHMVKTKNLKLICLHVPFHLIFYVVIIIMIQHYFHPKIVPKAKISYTLQ